MSGTRPDQVGFTRRERDSRVYVHDKCGQATRIDQGDFVQIANPFAIVSATICAHCGIVGTGSVAWEDTGEKISDYRSRMARLCPWWLTWSPIILPILLGGIGLVGGIVTAQGLAYDQMVTLVYVIIGAIFGFAVGWLVRPMLAEALLRTSFKDID